MCGLSVIVAISWVAEVASADGQVVVISEKRVCYAESLVCR